MRYIECGVNNEFVSGAGQVIGAAGSHHDVALRITFGEMWDGLSMYVTFRDALGENPTVVQILPTNLVLGTERTYDVIVPAAPKAKQGKAMVTVQGYTVVNGTQEANATNTATAYFIVLPSDYAVADDESIDATIAQQLQSEIDEISETVTDARLAAKDAEAWAVGQIEGADVPETDERYENNSKYYAQQADEYATDAATEAEAAEAWATGGEEGTPSATNNAKYYSEQAGSSATTASTKAGEASGSAAAALGSQTAAAASATEAESYAKGGTSSRAGEDIDNAKYYKEEAASSATIATNKASDASDSATTASGSATTATAKATLAESWAVGGTSSRSGEDTNNAKYYSEQASGSATTASNKASDASDSATAASGSATTATAKATLAESWAVGGTNTRTGEDTNNAKYWSEVAQQAAGGGVSSFNGRNGAVLPQSGDYTAAMVGAIPTTAKGAANGVAELDASGRIPSAQLPSYVDDVLEYETMAQFPATGESGKIYVDKLTNRTYRWGGTEYVEISESLALGETASTAYAGNKGKANADAITALQNAKQAIITAATIALTTSWSGNGPYTQTVTVNGGTANSKIDLQFTAAQLAQLMDDGVTAIYIENNNGTFTAYALGAAPTAAMSVQATVTEVTPAIQTPNTMTLSKSEITLDNDTPSDTFTINGDYDGIVAVTSSDTNVATVNLSGNIVTLTVAGSGTATITVSASGGNYTAASKTCSVTCSFIEDGEYGSKVIAGTKTKGSTVKFDGLDWIVANVSGNTYTLMLKKMTETTTFGSSTSYSGSTIASKCSTFQNAMSANALSVVNSKTVQSVTAKVWIAQKTDIASWTDSNDPTSSAWSGMRKWTGSSEDDYAVKDIYNYWCSDPSSSSNVLSINYNGYFGSIDPNTARGFRPCIEITQT